MDPQLQLFYRQYTQQFSALTYPPGELLKQEDVQKTLENNFFAPSAKLEVPASYQAKTLDRIIQLIEGAVRDHEEEGIIDALYERRAALCLRKGDDFMSIGLTKSQLIYHAPTDLSEPSTPILINEAKNIIGSGHNVGLRTWEASLRLAHYLFQHMDLVKGKTVLELGAGTGFLSLFCSTILSPKRVIATDYLDQILDSMRENLRLNERNPESSTGGPNIDIAKIDWEDENDLFVTLQAPISNSHLPSSPTSLIIPDVVLGADITYHPHALPPLVSLLSRILQLSKSPSNTAAPPRTLRVLISSTIRSSSTLSTFISLCHEHNLSVEEIDFTVPHSHLQKGLFHAIAMETKIFEITEMAFARADGVSEAEAGTISGT
jgi:protein-lysine N-methyltransferase EEF2KMT